MTLCGSHTLLFHNQTHFCDPSRTRLNLKFTVRNVMFHCLLWRLPRLNPQLRLRLNVGGLVNLGCLSLLRSFLPI